MNRKVNSYQQINEMLEKEQNYLQIIKSYCENEIDSCEVVPRILLLVENVCELHYTLYEKIDDLITEIGL